MSSNFHLKWFSHLISMLIISIYQRMRKKNHLTMRTTRDIKKTNLRTVLSCFLMIQLSSSWEPTGTPTKSYLGFRGNLILRSSLNFWTKKKEKEECQSCSQESILMRAAPNLTVLSMNCRSTTNKLGIISTVCPIGGTWTISRGSP